MRDSDALISTDDLAGRLVQPGCASTTARPISSRLIRARTIPPSGSRADLFLLHQLGFDDLTLYDGSMGEWAKNRSLPIETE